MTMPFLFLFWLMQPTVLEDSGLSTYHAPTATRLEPLPPKMDLSGLDESASPHSDINFAQEYSAQQVSDSGKESKPAKRATHASRKPQRIARRKEYQQPVSSYAR